MPRRACSSWCSCSCRNRASTSSNLGADITKLKQGVSLASLQGNQGMKGSEDVLNQTMKAQGLSFEQAAARRGDGRELVGTASMVAATSVG